MRGSPQPFLREKGHKFKKRKKRYLFSHEGMTFGIRNQFPFLALSIRGFSGQYVLNFVELW